MMAALLGRIDSFDPEQEEWAQYVERLVQFFEANDITGEDKAAKRRATFLSVIGPTPYKLLRSLIAPTKPTDKTFEELVAVLTEHYTVHSSQRSCNGSVSIPGRGKRENLWQRTSQNYVVLLNFVTSEPLWTNCSGTDSYGA